MEKRKARKAKALSKRDAGTNTDTALDMADAGTSTDDSKATPDTKSTMTEDSQRPEAADSNTAAELPIRGINVDGAAAAIEGPSSAPMPTETLSRPLKPTTGPDETLPADTEATKKSAASAADTDKTTLATVELVEKKMTPVNANAEVGALTRTSTLSAIEQGSALVDDNESWTSGPDAVDEMDDNDFDWDSDLSVSNRSCG